MENPAYHSGGSVIMGRRHITLTAAEIARAAAHQAWREAVLAGEIEKRFFWKVRVHALGRAIAECRQWRRAAGHADPHAADRRAA